MCDFEINFPENRSHPLYLLCVWACNNDKQLVWVNFLYVSDGVGECVCVCVGGGGFEGETGDTCFFLFFF